MIKWVFPIIMSALAIGNFLLAEIVFADYMLGIEKKFAAEIIINVLVGMLLLFYVRDAIRINLEEDSK